MPISVRRLLSPLFLVLLLAVALVLGRPAHAGALNDAWEMLTSPTWSWVVVPLLILALLAFAQVCRLAAACARERLHASRVARLMDVVGSQAAGIAMMLVTHPPAAIVAVQVVRQAAIARGVAYLRNNLPDTIEAIGVSEDTLAARLDNEVSGKLLMAGATLDEIVGNPARVGVAPAPAAAL